MEQSSNQTRIRAAADADLPFIRSLSPVLVAGAGLVWHGDAVVQKFQDDYIDEMMAPTEAANATLIAEEDGNPVGFIHMRAHTDEISGEASVTVPLLAVSENVQGAGIGRILMDAAEDWAKAQGSRLLHLEVFSANSQARAFYDKLGFKPETISMIKTLD